MKKLSIFCLMLLGLLLSTGCSSSDDALTELTIIRSNLDFDAGGGMGSVQLRSNGEVSAMVEADWCRTVSITGDMITVSVDINTGYESRSTQLAITDDSGTRQTTIYQQGAVLISKTNFFHVTNEKGEVPIELFSNLPIEITIPDVAKN